MGRRSPRRVIGNDPAGAGAGGGEAGRVQNVECRTKITIEINAPLQQQRSLCAAGRLEN